MKDDAKLGLVIYGRPFPPAMDQVTTYGDPCRATMEVWTCTRRPHVTGRHEAAGFPGRDGSPGPVYASWPQDTEPDA